MARRGAVDENDAVRKADALHLAEPAQVQVEDLALELVVVAEAVGAFVIEYFEDEVEGGRDELCGNGRTRTRADTHRREQRRHIKAPAG